MKYRIRDGICYTVKDGEAVLLDSESGVFFALNETGTKLWQAIVDGDISALARDYSSQYGVEQEQIRADLEELLQRLQAHKLIEPVGSTR